MFALLTAALRSQRYICQCITVWLQSSLGESEKRLKALQDTVQQRGTAVPFLSHGNQSAQVRAMLLLNHHLNHYT